MITQEPLSSDAVSQAVFLVVDATVALLLAQAAELEVACAVTMTSDDLDLI